MLVCSFRPLSGTSKGRVWWYLPGALTSATGDRGLRGWYLRGHPGDAVLIEQVMVTHPRGTNRMLGYCWLIAEVNRDREKATARFGPFGSAAVAGLLRHLLRLSGTAEQPPFFEQLPGHGASFHFVLSLFHKLPWTAQAAVGILTGCFRTSCAQAAKAQGDGIRHRLKVRMGCFSLLSVMATC